MRLANISLTTCSVITELFMFEYLSDERTR